jgi:hypothetical protein
MSPSVLNWKLHKWDSPRQHRMETIIKWGLRCLLSRLLSCLHARIPPTKHVSERIV